MKVTKKIKTSRNPLAMVVASLILLLGVALTIAGCLSFSNLGWTALLIVAGGLINVASALATLITGKAEYILLDLLLSS